MNINFEQAPIEKDIQGLSQEIKERQAESNVEVSSETEVKDFLKTKIGDSVVRAKTNIQSSDSTLDENKTLPDYLINESKEIKNKVEQLITLAFNEGIEKSIKEATKSGPFILDAFHDALTSKLYDELKKRKLLN
ncbi:hypothetical protein KJ671_03890 [Patescibacteria group bacterium]|nr:hypothetical protein [Patescibacteria group bacterium]